MSRRQSTEERQKSFASRESVSGECRYQTSALRLFYVIIACIILFVPNYFPRAKPNQAKRSTKFYVYKFYCLHKKKKNYVKWKTRTFLFSDRTWAPQDYRNNDDDDFRVLFRSFFLKYVDTRNCASLRRIHIDHVGTSTKNRQKVFASVGIFAAGWKYFSLTLCRYLRHACGAR